MDHKPARVYREAWTNHRHESEPVVAQGSAPQKPVHVTVVNQPSEEKNADSDPINELKAEAARKVLNHTDLWGGIILLGLVGLAVFLIKSSGGEK